MAHKKNIGAEIVKTYSFKVKNTNGITMEKLMNAIDEYQSYYNLCSDWICKNLTTMTIGDLDRYIPEKAKDNIYATVLLDEVWKNQPLYKIFGKKYSSNNRINALYCTLSSVIDINKKKADLKEIKEKKENLISRIEEINLQINKLLLEEKNKNFFGDFCLDFCISSLFHWLPL